MENNMNTYADLDKEIEQLRQNQASIIFNGNEISHQTLCVRNVLGRVSLVTAPHFGLVLNCGSPEHSMKIPLILVDSADNTAQWIMVVGKKLLFHQLRIVFERFNNEDKHLNVECISAFAMWKDIEVLDESVVNKKLNSPKPAHTRIVGKEFLQAQQDSNMVCRIMVHHTTSAFYVDESSVLCLLLISYTNKKKVATKLWLVLRDDQVAWKEFLIPNREYLIVFPIKFDQVWFDKSRTPLIKMLTTNCLELKTLFQHTQLFSTVDGAFLPLGSLVFLCSSSPFSKYISRFMPDPLSLWFSCSEADHVDAGLITVYGQVHTVKYDYETGYKSFYLCLSQAKRPPITKPNVSQTHPWVNPWMSKSSLTEDEILSLPRAENGSNVMSTGVPGKMVEILKLRDIITGKELSVYLKHSYTSKTQRVCRLSAGMIVCVSHLDRRCSSQGNYYYTTTMLSTIRVLMVPDDLSENESWGIYGMNYSADTPDYEQMWGVLETTNLLKVSVTARCTLCGTTFYKGTCSEDCIEPSAQVSATAISWLQVINNEDSISMEKVIIKDDLVRELLCIPKNIWQIFQKNAVRDEIVYLFSDLNFNDSPKSSDFCELFQMYCSIPKPNGKFYVSVKKMTSRGNEPCFYCIHLKPVDERRLSIVAELTKKVLAR